MRDVGRDVRRGSACRRARRHGFIDNCRRYQECLQLLRGLRLLLTVGVVVVIVVNVVEVLYQLVPLTVFVGCCLLWLFPCLLLLLLLLLLWILRRYGHQMIVGTLQDGFNGFVCISLRRGQVQVLLAQLCGGGAVAQRVLKLKMIFNMRSLVQIQ